MSRREQNSHKHGASDRWQIWIDTGGTFTDCLAVAPSGEMRRAKVLSNATLRGRVVRRVDARQFIIEQNWNGCDDLIAGMDARLFQSTVRLLAKNRNMPAVSLDATGHTAVGRVRRFAAAESLVDLESHTEASLETGDAIEFGSSEPAPILAARLVTQTPGGASLPPMAMRLATTRGTNALLQRNGMPVALFITKGFGDLLHIGDQQRPDLFALNIVKPLPLHAVSIEVIERLNADGSVYVPLDAEELRRRAELVLGSGVRNAAVALLHSHVNPAHEREAAAVLREMGFAHVTCSSEVAPLIKILLRAQTAVADAYLSPVIEGYLKDVQRFLGDDSSLHVMTSAGGLVRASSYRACESLLSGPAGGVAGMAVAGARSGFARLIGFDMGGTSTDVARFDGEFDYRFEHAVAGVRLMSPALNIHSVAAGGGSICDFVDGHLCVGPRSAGATPGPACYGAGGPLAITDVNLLLGRLDAAQFEIPISIEAAKRALDGLVKRVEAATAKAVNADELLDGLLEIANERMAAAIEHISVREGHDPADHALLAFGGAGGQHACALARRLGMREIIVPEDASLLSAMGLGHAAIERISQRQVLKRLDADDLKLMEMLNDAGREAMEAVMTEEAVSGSVAVRRRMVNLRLAGQDHSLSIDVPAEVCNQATLTAHLKREFATRYQAMFGHAPSGDKAIEVESLRVVAATGVAEVRAAARIEQQRDAVTSRCIRARFGGRWVEVPTFDRSQLVPGARMVGPALVLDRRTTVVVEEGWNAHIDHAGAVVLRMSDATRQALGGGGAQVGRSEIVAAELFSNRLTSIAVDMGQMLQRTALSTNVKERLDFSCAVLDAHGRLAVNAPHIPVHLGAMGMCVRAVREVIEMRPGDVVVTNHPRFGGTHLPDVTVITPVFAPGRERETASVVGGEGQSATLIGYVASRAHHAELGGTRPGSMPPSATTLMEEGVVIEPRYLIRGGQSCFDEIERLLRALPHPSRAVMDNLADLRAAVAANERGRQGLVRLAQQSSTQDLAQRMERIAQRAEELTREALAARAGRYAAVERLDDGSPIHVTIEIDANGGAVFDFAGTAAQHAGNLNATPAIVHSAVMYVLRLMIGRDVPLNEGMMAAVEVRIPEGSMLNPHFETDASRCPAVVGGNTETSQRLVDTLIKALGLTACSQGTMNNVLFGNARFGYYETICGGAGATNGSQGADAVHTHMTNTRITDPEIIEHRYPVRLERFAIRRGSGGDGTWRGGDGAVREMTFLEPMSLSVLTQHRVERPYGMDGGGAGLAGVQRIIRASGEVVPLHAVDACEVSKGDRMVIETPGGGGWGLSSELTIGD